VLPFVNMSGDKEQEYFSDGLAEEIINALTQIPGLKVTARTSAFAFKGKQKDIRKIAEALGVANILEGSVRKASNRIRITAQLISAADGNHIWSERYDREMTDVFEIQDEISQAIVRKLQMRLSGDRPPARLRTGNIEAYNLCLKARYHSLKITEEGLTKGKDCCEQAIAMDPNCALAWSLIAAFYQLMGTIGRMPWKEAHEQSFRTVMRAVAIDETLPDAHVILGINRAFAFDWEGADHEFRRALELAPESTEALRLYAFYYLLPMRRSNEAIALMKKALEMDPLLPVLQWAIGVAHFYAREWRQAIAQLRSVLEVDPHYWLAHAILGLIHIETGKADEGIRACETAAQLAGRNPYALGVLGWACARGGRADEARRVLKELEGHARETHVLPGAIARTYLGLGEIDRALECIDKAIDDHDGGMIHLHLVPIYDPLRSHPRYHALLRKMNL